MTLQSTFPPVVTLNSQVRVVAEEYSIHIPNLTLIPAQQPSAIVAEIPRYVIALTSQPPGKHHKRSGPVWLHQRMSSLGSWS